MVTALILMAIALIICLAFMGITTWLYFQLEKDFERQKLALQGFANQFELYCADMANQNEKAKALLEDVKAEAKAHLEDARAEAKRTVTLVDNGLKYSKKATEAAEFAMQTVQEVRKMLRMEKAGGQRVLYVNGKPAEIRSTGDKDNTSMKDFKYEEKEEDPEEPRS